MDSTCKARMSELDLKGNSFLVVDDETDLRDIIASELEFMGGKSFQAENIISAQKIISAHKIDLIISDIRMPGGTGIDLLKIVKAHDPFSPSVMLITGFADVTMEDALDMGAETLISKPFKLDDLIRLAGKFSLPWENRFKEKVSSSKGLQYKSPLTLKQKIEAKDCLIGRGGMALKLETTAIKRELGEPYQFEFEFKDVKWEGVGMNRWFKGHDRPCLGIEFLSLTDSTLALFQQLVKDHRPVSYIPKLDV